MHKTVVLCFVGWVASTSAIVVQDYTTAENAPSGLDWRHVHNYKGSSAVAVDAYWTLTAAHVADDPGTGALSIDGNIYNQQEIVYHDSVDLALVRYDKALPGHYSLYTGDLLPQGDDPKLSVLMVGYGTIGSVAPTFWTDNGSGRGTKRWGSQEIDKTAIKRYKVEDTFTENNGFWMDFDLGNTDYEAGAGIGDSGGGTFYNDGGIWKLAGINTLRSGSGVEYNSTFSISMPDYSSWVVETIPEPVTSYMIGLSTMGLLITRASSRPKGALRSLFPIKCEYLCDSYTAEEERNGREKLHTSGNESEVNLTIKRLRKAFGVLRDRYALLDRIFWNRMVARHEKNVLRKQTFKKALKKKAFDGFDAFLALIMK